jgi:polyketide synthase PksN
MGASSTIGKADIAIIGMAGCFPGARDLEEFWDLLSQGNEGLSRFTDNELIAAGVSRELIADPRYVKVHGVLADVELFDAAFFGITPTEAELTDPQHRVFLQCCHSALEAAGYDPARFDGLIGVWAGASMNSYFPQHVLPNVDQTATSKQFLVMIGNDKDFLATRVSYKLNLTGPSFTVQTACSTSLAAVHLAAQALLNGECDMALAGGVTVKLPQVRGYLYEDGGILSADGHVRSFDAQASGAVLGNGAGVVVLRLLEDAIAARDTIHAVIKGTAVNNDGSAKVSFTAPSREGQAAVIAEAHAVSAVEPGTITYIEAHGTATRLGDPVEVSALTDAFRKGTGEKGFCAIGSVKSNIGHLDAAAGVAGVIKTALMLRHKMLVPAINYAEPNRSIGLADSPFYVNTELREWKAAAVPRRAGVSSFGFGGTNVHIVMQEAPPLVQSGVSRPEQLVLLSAKTSTALDRLTDRLARHLKNHPEINLADAAYSLAVGRQFHRYRRALICRTIDDAVRLLERNELPVGDTHARAGDPGSISFMFPEEVAAAARRSAELASTEAVFRTHFEDCLAAGALQIGEAGEAFAFQIAVAELLLHWGLKPKAVCGRGRGQIAAAHFAGALALDEALACLQAAAEPALPRKELRFPLAPSQPCPGPEPLMLEVGTTAPLATLRRAWLAGVDLDWARFFSPETRHRIALPTYPFEGRRYWMSAPSLPPAAFGPKTRPHPLLDANVSTFQHHRFIATPTGHEFYLADHAVFGESIVPAAVYLEMARAAGEGAGGTSVRAIRGVTFERKISFAGGRRTIAVTLVPAGSKARFEIAASAPDEVCARGEVILAAGAPDAGATQMDIEAIKRRCARRIAADACYDVLCSRGLVYGPSFRTIRELAAGTREVIAVLEAPESCAAAWDDFVLHPSLVDGALQALVVLLASAAEDDDECYLPLALGELEIRGRLPRRCIVHAVLAPERRSLGRPIETADLVLLDEDGVILARMTDFSVRKLKRARPDARGLFRAEWVESSGDAGGSCLPGPYLLLSDDARISDALRRVLAAAGQSETPLVLATTGADFRKHNARSYQINSARPDDFARLLASLSDDGVPPVTVVHALSEDFDPEQGIPPVQFERGIGSLFHLSKALMEKRINGSATLIFVHRDAGGGGSPLNEAVAAFGRTVRLEYPRLRYKVVGIGATDDLASCLTQELSSDAASDVEVRHRGGRRLIRRYGVVDVAGGARDASMLRNGGVYLITGGAGGLGLLLAEHLATRAGAHLVLTGRSPLKPAARERIAALHARGASVAYIPADVAKEDDVRTLIAAIRANYGPLRGVVHAAGVLADSFFLNKTPDDFAAVVAPKVQGTVNLDRLTKDEELDFFVTFSSIAAAFGNVGQADYAFANAFMDAYMLHRDALVAGGRRKGRSLSIAWPYWQAGGMVQDEQATKAGRERLGFGPLPTADGLAIFEDALGFSGNLLAAFGDVDKIAAALAQPAPVSNGAAAIPGAAADEQELRQKIGGFLREILAKETKLHADDIDMRLPLGRYGIESMMILRLNGELERHFGSLSKTLFFEFATLEEIAAYFVTEHGPRCRELLGVAAATSSVSAAAKERQAAAPALPAAHRREDDGIAIVGLSGRYPIADDMEEFWANLAQGRDCITEIPADRWDHSRFFDPDPTARGRAYSKWGGFLRDVDRFDPLFFNIAPREAELMDPQERLFLQTAWHVLEDAGYRRGDLEQHEVGVFVGVMFGDYQFYGAADALKGGQLVTGSSFASIANRVSYVLNLRGPSLAVDTMCSSSLTAIHLACESIRRGESDFAIAGGVNLSLHPYKYVLLSQGKFVSFDGRCRAFGAGGTGYVPGEGVGAVLLKPRRKAIEDRDHIYGVILGQAVNHGGKTNSYTVPNPNAQQRVIARAIEQAGVSPRQISYVEAHGTGTTLGDPIEIAALNKIYRPNAFDGRRCAIGSVKSNIGHLESAAGIAGLTKVLLQFKHRQLAPSLHAQQLNPNIDFADSPFQLQRELEEWSAPTPAGSTEPRRAALSSFGAGGANAHAIIEEHQDAASVAASVAAKQHTAEPLLFVLSARDGERLREYAERLGRFLEKERAELADVAYTLQIGREAMEQRLAVVSDDGHFVAATLLKFARGDAGPSDCLFGQAQPALRQVAAVQIALELKDLPALSHLWVEGAEIDWHLLHAGPDGKHGAKRISLPGYPFAREQYWISTANENPAAATVQPAMSLHPLLDANDSTIEETRFCKTLRADAALVRDHVIAGRPLLSGAACLEMVRAAAERASRRPLRKLRDVIWARPIAVEGEETKVFVGMHAEADAAVFEVFTERDGARVTHVRGTAAYDGDADGGAGGDRTLFDIDEIRRRCPQRKQGADIYLEYQRAGFEYGATYRVIQEIDIGPDAVLARLRLPQQGHADHGGFFLHPSLLDGALRACHWLDRRAPLAAADLTIPFSLGALELYAPLPNTCYAYARAARTIGTDGAKVLRYDVVLLDEHGAVLARIDDFAGRLPHTERPRGAEGDLLFYEPAWQPCPPPPIGAVSGAVAALLVLSNGVDVAGRLAASGRWTRVIAVRPGTRFERDAHDRYTIDPAVPDHYRKLITEVARDCPSALAVAHLWSIPTSPPCIDDEPALRALHARLGAAFDRGIFSALYLLQSIAAAPLEGRTRCVYLHAATKDNALPEHEMLAGFALSSMRIAPQFELVSVQCEGAATDADLARILMTELAGDERRKDAEIRYHDGRRFVRRMRAIDRHDAGTAPPPGIPLRQSGVYLLTGGYGRIGLLFARYLAERYKARLVLTGRSPPSPAVSNAVEQLERLGATVLKLQADVAVPNDVERVLATTKLHFGRIDGIFHLAGVADNTLALECDRAAFDRVLAAKTYGTVNLDVLTRAEPLDAFVMFSSISAMIGDFGSCSYAAANRFMCAYAELRERRVREGGRFGRTLSLGWPLWDIGGVDRLVRDDELEAYIESSGMPLLTPEAGLRAFERAWEFGRVRLVPAIGNHKAIARVLGAAGASADAPERKAAAADKLLAAALGYLRLQLAAVLKIAPARIGENTPLENYGLDSVTIMETNALLRRQFPGLPGTLFFEYRTLADLAAYFVREHSAAAARLLAATAPTAATPAAPFAAISGRRRESPSPDDARREPESQVEEDIAIIGISGRYPQARDLEEFWENIRVGKDCIEEIPPERWSADEFYDPDPAAAGKSCSRWGGFLSDVDKFDSQFFRLSPLQAKSMDPQERLFLETAWATIEDAGYSLDRLPRARFAEAGRDVGVFVGVMWGDYAILGAQESLKGNHVVTLANRAGIANWISYFGDFRGPSIVVDTACSSSLVAIHMACESLRRGECSYAIAGGVNVSVHPLKYLHLSRKGMLARDGRCRSFGARGSGYVPGEGVGAVLLKKLSRAVADGDHIHAVIKASAVNHGGRTSGFTVPNPRAQQALFEEALAKARIDPRTIGYIEAHGTGTALGDPIEHSGLQCVLERYTQDAHVCALGSVKSNIGHLESAAGIAGVTKIVLQMRHRQLAPSLHAEELNPEIDFSRSPFKVQRELTTWPRVVWRDAGAAVELPLRAAVSSFGAGGTNSHVILEEYVTPADAAQAAESAEPELLVLSAQNEERLRAYANKLAAFLRRQRTMEMRCSLRDVAFTLQVGREAMADRLGFVAGDFDDAIAKLELAGRGEADDGIARGQVKEHSDLSELFAGGGGPEFLKSLIVDGADAKLAHLWVSGVAVDWETLHQARPRRRRRTALPTYPFAPEPHWIPIISKREPADGRTVSVAANRTEKRRIITSEDPMVRDHIVGGRKILPGVAHLELVLEAAEDADGGQTLENVCWTTPVTFDGEAKEIVVVKSRAGDAQRFELRTGANGGEIVHSQGVILPAAVSGAEESLSLSDVRARCPHQLEGETLYAFLQSQGLQYGKAFRAVERAWVGCDEVLARLRLPQDVECNTGSYRLHPTLADAALHAIAALFYRDGNTLRQPLMPFCVDRVEIRRPVPLQSCHAHIRRFGDTRCHVSLVDDAGRVCVRFHGLSYRPIKEAQPQFTYRPCWIHAPLESQAQVAAGGTVLMIGSAPAGSLAAALARAHAGAQVVHLELAPGKPAATDIQGALARLPRVDLIYFLAITDTAASQSEAALLQEGSEQSVIALFRIVRILSSGRFMQAPPQLKIVTNDVFPLWTGDASRPWAAGVVGLCMALNKEYPQLQIACVDIRGAELATAAADVATEPFAARANPILLRDGVRYARRLERVRLPPSGQGRFRQRGIYLILGGLGVIGLDTSLYLAAAYGARLVLVGRGELDAARREKVARIERAGGEVVYLACDAANAPALQRIVELAKARFGALNGVIHSAMVLKNRRISDLDEQSVRAALAPKVQTTWNLFEAVRNEPLDFFLLYSSGISFEGNVSQAGYAAGCCFEDAFALHAARTAAFPVKVINWGYWHAGGIAAREQLVRRLERVGIQPIAAAEGMEILEQFLACPLPQILASKLSDHVLDNIGLDLRVETELQPRGVPSPAPPIVDCAPILPAVAQQVEAQQRAWRAAERLGQHLVLGAFRRMGSLLRAHERHRKDELRARLGILPEYFRLYDALLEALAAGGLVRIEADAIVATRLMEVEEVERNLADPQGAKQALVTAHPMSGPVATLLLACTDAMPDVLTGARNPLEVIFPSGSMDLVAGIYKDNPIADYYNDLVARIARRQVEDRLAAAPEARLRLLEIGAGMGSTAAPLLAAMAAFGDRLEYTYTDISSHFVKRAEKQFGRDYPFAEFRVLDIEAALAPQGFERGQYDIVLGTNVLHATRRIGHTLRQVKQLMRANGVLLANEGTRIERVATMTFGLTSGWWRYEDPAVRLPHSPLLSATKWTDALAACNFRNISVHRLAATSQGELFQSLIAAESDGVVTVESSALRRRVEPPSEPEPRAILMTDHTAEPSAAASGPRHHDMERYIRGVFGRVLEMSEDRFDPKATFDKYGVDSLVALQLIKEFEGHFGRLPPTLLFERITIEQLARYFIGEHSDAAQAVARTGLNGDSPGRPGDAQAPPIIYIADNGNGELSRAIGALSDEEVDGLLQELQVVLSEQKQLR